MEIRNEDDIVVLTPRGMLLGGKETDELQERIKELDSSGNQKLIIDLGKTTYMSSMGLSAIFRAYVSYSKRNARIKVCNVDRKIQQLFVLVKLPLVFGDDLHETLDEALASFRTTAPTAG